MIDQKSDLKTKPLPKTCEKLDLGLHFSTGEMQRIRQGFVPQSMDDKWFICFSNNILYLHRSWTGICIYKAYFKREKIGFTLTHAEVNRNPDQYSETDVNQDRHQLDHLIKFYLLLRVPDFGSSHSVQNNPPDCVRFVPARMFSGMPAPAHRPFAFYADAASLYGKTVADCYRLVTGKPQEGDWPNHVVSPFTGFHSDGLWDTPLVRPVAQAGRLNFSPVSDAELNQEEFVVITVSSEIAQWSLDAFPATWSALAYILTDEQRMSAQPAGWDIEPNQYASARLFALFNNLLARNDDDRLALLKSREEIGLCDFERIRTSAEERDYYSYISHDSCFTDQIVELFGISSRCWHGCGYIGHEKNPLCRLLLLRNQIISGMELTIKSGSELF